MLEAHASAGAFLDESLKSDSGDASRLGEGARAAESVALQETPTRIGQYRVIRELGRGGMGAVYLAERDDPGLRKTVAIKVVRRDSHFMLRRFRTESQILSGLEHPASRGCTTAAQPTRACRFSSWSTSQARTSLPTATRTICRSRIACGCSGVSVMPSSSRIRASSSIGI
jgi:serine/threonine protein kinase